MKPLILILTAAATLALAGCASGPKFTEVAASMPAVKAGQGRVFFLRESSMMGAALQPEIRLNGEVVGHSVPGGFFYVDRPAGSFSAAASTEVENTLSFRLDAGETKYIRTYPSFGLMVGHIQLELEPADKARAELATLSLTKAEAKK